MENTKSEKNDNFKAKVHRILYESNTSSSDDDSLTFAELPEQRRPITDQLELSAVELLHRHEEFITKQRNAVIKMQQKGILTVSSKYRVDGLVENGVLAEEQPSGENSNSKEPRLPQTGKNRRRKMKKKRRREQELTKTSTKKLKLKD